MRKNALRLLAASAFAAIAAPIAANEFDQVWNCELNPGKSLDDAQAVSLSWLKAAKSMESGDQLQAFINYPIIVSASQNRFDFVVRAPSLAAWGAFYDKYDSGTAVAKADEEFATVATCSGSTMWENIKVE